MPGETRIKLQTEVVDRIAEGIGLVLAASAHLLLSGFQVVEHRRLVVIFGIDRQRLDSHTDRVQEPLVRAAIIDGKEE